MKCRNSNQQITITRVIGNKAAGLLTFVPVLLLLCGSLAHAQDRQSSAGPTWELGREHLSYAAASPADLMAVLQKDPGLMVELKRCVAKDTTSHGHIISPRELTHGVG